MGYRWNNFSVIDEKQIGDGNISVGDSFTYTGAHAEMYVRDNDRGLAGDRGANERGSDNQGGKIYEDGEWTNAGNVYWEGYFVMRGSDGRNYYMIEIEGTCLDDSQDYFAFYGAVPAQGVTLTASCYYGDCGSLSYSCLDGGEIGTTPVSPEAANDYLSVFQGEGEDGADINVLLNDDSNTGEALVVKEVDGSASVVGVWVDLDNGGRVMIAADGSVDFDADGDFDALGAGETATVSINYTVLNSDGLEDTATLTIEVTGVNDAPVAVDQAVRTSEDDPVSGNVLDGAFDVDGDAVSLDGLSIGAIGEEIEVTTANGYTGTIVVNADGTFTFTPGPDANEMAQGETDTFTFDFTVKSQDGTTSVGTTRTIDFESATGVVTTENGLGNPGNDKAVGGAGENPNGTGSAGNSGANGNSDGFAVNGTTTSGGGALNAGDVITTQIDGVTISVKANGKGAKYNEAMIFDSNNPTGGDDDLETSTQNNILIISEDGHSHDPDDNGKGGEIRFTFDEPTDVKSLTLIDNEEGVWIGFFDENWNQTGSQWVSGGADNSVNQVALDGQDVTHMLVVMHGSGAVDDLVISDSEEVPAYLYDTATVTVTIEGESDGPTAVADVAITDEDNSISGNVIDNDLDADGYEVTAISGGEVGETFTVTSSDGRTGELTINADGSYTFDPANGFEDLNPGESDTITVTYSLGQDVEVVDRLIENGDFEATDDSIINNRSGSGRWEYLDDSKIDAWSSIDGKKLELQRGEVAGLTGNALTNSMLELDSTGNSGITQDIEVGADGTFDLSFDYWPRARKGEIEETSKFKVIVDGNVVGEFTGTEVREYSETLSLTLSAGTHTITFQGSGTSDSYGSRLDNIDMVRTSGGDTTTEVTSAELTITVTGVADNTAPTVVAQTATTDENTTVFGDLLDGATDAEGDDITVESTEFGAPGTYAGVATDGGNTGTLTVTADGMFSFTPDGVDLDLGETDTITFSFTATDGEFASSATATITITGLNEAPTVTNQALSVNEQNAAGLSATVGGDLLAGAADADGDAISLASVDVGAIGSTVSVTTTNGGTGELTINADGTFDFVSTSEGLNTGDEDTLVINFTAESSGGTTVQSAAGQVVITINGVNVDPVAVDIAVSGDEADNDGLATPIEGDLLAGSSDADGDAISLLSTSLGTIGSTVAITTDGGRSGDLTINGDGTFSFVSTDNSLDLDQTDTISFTYTVESADGAATRTDTAAATITINGLNAAPTVENQAVSVNEANDQGMLAEVSGNLLIGAADEDLDLVDIQSVSVGTIGATVSVTTDGGNTGELTINTDGSFTFVSTSSNLDLGETDTLTIDFTGVSNGGFTDQTASAQAVITINGVNVAPVAVSQSYAINEANAIGFSPVEASGNLLDGGSDADGDALALSGVTAGGAAIAIGVPTIIQTVEGADVELLVEANGDFTLTALDDSMDIGESDSVSFQFTLESSGGVTTQVSNTSEVNVSINGVNIAPVAAPVQVSTNEANDDGFVSTVSGDLLAGAVDQDGDVITLESFAIDGVPGTVGTAIAVNTAQGGTGLLTVNPDGTFTYESTSDALDQGQPDSFSFEFTVQSSGGVVNRTDSAIATVDISGVNEAPVAIDHLYAITEDDVPMEALLAGATDGDGDAVTFIGASDANTGAAYNLQVNNFIPRYNPVTTDGGYAALLQVSVTGMMTFIPSQELKDALDAGETDSFTFNYQVASNGGAVDQFDTASTTISISGLDPNGVPIADVQEVTILESEVASGDLNDVVSDPDGDALTITEINGVAINPGGTVTLTSASTGFAGDLVVQSDGTYTFTPGSSFVDGLDDGDTDTVTFSYTVSDGEDTATNDVTITINGEDDAGGGPIVDPDDGNDVNVIYLFDASAEMFASTIDCNGDGVYDESFFELAADAANGLQANMGLIYQFFGGGQSVDDDYYAYGQFATEVASTNDITQLSGVSDLAAALGTLTLDTTKETRIYVFTNDVADAAAADAAAQTIVDAYAAAGTTLAIDAVALGIEDSLDLFDAVQDLELIDTDVSSGMGGGIGIGLPIGISSDTVDIIDACDDDFVNPAVQELINDLSGIS